MVDYNGFARWPYKAVEHTPHYQAWWQFIFVHGVLQLIPTAVVVLLVLLQQSVESIVWFGVISVAAELVLAATLIDRWYR